MALKLGSQALRSYLKLACEYKLHILPNTEVSTAKDHGKNYMKVRPPMVRHLLRNRLLFLLHPLFRDLFSMWQIGFQILELRIELASCLII